VYDIHVRNESGVCRGVASVTVDGAPVDGTLLPLFSEGTHEVRVVL